MRVDALQSLFNYCFTGLYDVGGYETLREKFMISSADDVMETQARFGESHFIMSVQSAIIILL